MSCDIDHEKMKSLLSGFKNTYKHIAVERCKNDEEMFVFIHEMTTYSTLLLISLFEDMDAPTEEMFDKFMRRTRKRYDEEFNDCGLEQRAH